MTTEALLCESTDLPIAVKMEDDFKSKGSGLLAGSLAVFLAGDAAATITGASYSIDGGWTAQ